MTRNVKGRTATPATSAERASLLLGVSSKLIYKVKRMRMEAAGEKADIILCDAWASVNPERLNLPGQPETPGANDNAPRTILRAS
jgi:hypothetical protein